MAAVDDKQPIWIANGADRRLKHARGEAGRHRCRTQTSL